MPMRKRLHISPLSEELLPAILGHQLLPLAANLSFHTIRAHPDQLYGFVELPEMDATRLQKKLDGTILRGKKLRIGEAREDVRRKRDHESGQVQEEDTKPLALRKSKRKREDKANIIQGYELPADRKVKRGWTDPKADNKEQRKKGSDKLKDGKVQRIEPSKFMRASECLFQTNLPPAATRLDDGSSQKNRKSIGKKVVVHEFEKTYKHPTFLREADLKKDTASTSEAATESFHALQETEHDSEDEASDQQSSSAAESAQEQSSPTHTRIRTDEAVKNDRESLSYVPTLELTQSSPMTVEPHSLETLFKRPKPPTSTPTTSQKSDLQVKVPFSFFGDGTDNDNVEKSLETPGLPRTRRSKAAGLPNLSIPVTPYTQRDMSWRSQRSAAPTPDTAAPGKSGFGDVWNRLHEDREDDIEEADEENDSEEEGEASSVKDTAPTASTDDANSNPVKKEESEFTTWFWAHRGENNRAWKRRRREAAREERQRESKRRKKAN